MGRNASGLGEASDTDAVAHDGAFVQLEQSQIVPEEGDAADFRAKLAKGDLSRESICCYQS